MGHIGSSPWRHDISKSAGQVGVVQRFPYKFEAMAVHAYTFLCELSQLQLSEVCHSDVCGVLTLPEKQRTLVISWHSQQSPSARERVFRSIGA